ncbi:MAG: amidohydrolase, partial [Gammaproteobacteria bacterium]
LLRQTFLDAQWFGQRQPRPFTDATLEAWLDTQALPQIMEVNNWHQAIKVDEIGDEFGVQYVLKTGGDDYRRIDLLRQTNAPLIVPLDFPEAPDVDDALDADEVSFEDLKHWELAPFNPRLLAEAGITFALTAHGTDDDFWERLHTAVDKGLPEDVAIAALTRTPAQMLGIDGLVGELGAGRLANLLITDGPLLDKDSTILENWIQGERYQLQDDSNALAGRYLLAVAGNEFELELSFEQQDASAELQLDNDDTRAVNIDLSDDLIALNFLLDEAGNRVRLNGWPIANGWRGNGRDGAGSNVAWTMTRMGNTENAADPANDAGSVPALPSPVLYPFAAYGRESLPQQQDLLIRGATVWTNEDQGVLITDVLVRDGRIAELGNNLSANSVTVVDGTGKHLTPGIIDEHSHIALFSINETQTNSSMVRMKDVVNSENINIYRNLAGGVVAAQLLHGSANPIGGQSALIKMRWGTPPQELLVENADEFIKFALGENVKRSTNPASIRYPQTRMGVEQVFVNAFSQAREYGRTWDEYNNLSRNQQRDTPSPRRDLVHEAMLEILNGERFVTSHSYVQSEINMLMHVADTFDFNINTFTHILEGYKV